MKKFAVIFVLLIFCFNQLGAVPEVGIRYLKLGNTYREVGNYEKAEEYINKGRKLFAGKAAWSYKYWTAVADEYLGYLYISLSKDQTNKDNKEYFKQLAIENFNRALASYEKLISNKDGSQVPLKEIISSLDIIQKQKASLGRTAFVGGDVLNYERLKLREVPIGIPESVNNLSLAENKFRDFPSGIVRFSNLKYLNLSNNGIRTISQDIEQLSNLEWLDLSNNKISELPETICNLISIEELDLSNNKLKKVPACLCQMSSLKILNLRGNKLPYSEVANLVKCLPNTNIFIDEYERVEEKDEIQAIID